MSQERDIPLSTSHLEFPGLWELKDKPNPTLLHQYIGWLVSDDERFSSAVDSMQWFPPGFHGLLIAIDKGESDQTHRASLQLNFYHEDYPGDEEPHAHARDAVSSWYAPAGTRQVLTRYHVLPDSAPVFKGLPVEERVLIANNIGDMGDGQRPVYMPVALGRALILPRSVTNVAPLGSQRFDSTEVHHAGFSGKGVAVSVHYKGPEEVAELNTFEGFVHYKGIRSDAAAELVETRRALASSLQQDRAAGRLRLAPSTTLYPTTDEAEAILQRGKIPRPDAQVSEMMIRGALATVRTLAA